MAATHRLTVNGVAHSVQAPDDMPLLWVLRDLLGLRGTKFSCGIAQCRACTVHVDGEATFSCQLRIADAAGTAITTIEGLSPDRSHPLQRAWIAEQVPQCGYCQPGQIMSAAALLARTPRPSHDDIDRAMHGNLCRCGSYPRIKRAIARAAGMDLDEREPAAGPATPARAPGDGDSDDRANGTGHSDGGDTRDGGDGHAD